MSNLLDPSNRAVLLDALRPPEGYVLDHALGMSFTLDLLALLVVPLEFTLFNWKDEEGKPSVEPIALMEAVRQTAGKLTVFVQAGAIAVPRRVQLLYSYLEGTVHELAAPRRGGIFHPKVWVLRYTADGGSTKYRVICGTRNLTFDHCWDTALVMEGDYKGRKNAFARNHALGDLVAALPAMAVRSLPEEVREETNRIQHEVRRVDFEIPEAFERYEFSALGLEGSPRWPFPTSCRRCLIVSPFIGERMLSRLSEASDEALLVSRPETLREVDAAILERFATVWELNEFAEGEPHEPEGELLPTTDNELPTAGLHAKLYAFENGWDASLFTGSANATEAALGLNVEFLVALHGKRSQCGIDQLLGIDEEGTTLRTLLVEHIVGAVERDDVQKALELHVESIRKAISTMQFIGSITPDGDNPETFGLSLRVRGKRTLKLEEGIQIACWPITLIRERASQIVELDGKELAAFYGMSLEALTSFIGFEIKAKRNDRTAEARFVVNVPLVGLPVAERNARILRSLFKDRAQVLRLLLLLLASDEEEAREALLRTGAIDDEGRDASGVDELPLLEPMVKALARDPDRLKHVKRIVDDLASSQETAHLLPEGFDEIWKPIWETAEKSRK